MTEELALLKHNILRNALYHTARRRSLERQSRVFSFMVIVLGTAAASQALLNLGLSATWPALAVAVVGAIQLVFDPAGKARDHQLLQRDYYNLLTELERADAPTRELISNGWADMTRITADEPPTFRAIDAKAHNDAIDALAIFDRRTERLFIPWHHSAFGGILHFEGYDYKKFGEMLA